MRANRLWIGVTCGVALALSVVAAVDAGGTQTAGAQANVDAADHARRANARDGGLGRPPADGDSCGPVEINGDIKARSNPSIQPTGPPPPPARSGHPQKDGDYIVDFNIPSRALARRPPPASAAPPTRYPSSPSPPPDRGDR